MTWSADATVLTEPSSHAALETRAMFVLKGVQEVTITAYS